MENTNNIETGRCQCGKVYYSFPRKKVISAHHCHCKDCQRITGSGKATIVFVSKKNIEIKLTRRSDKKGPDTNKGIIKTQDMNKIF